VTLYTVYEASAILKITKTTLYSLIKRGDLKSSRVGSQHRISEEQIRAFLQTGEK